jgi:EmrB/QacA subfamily drug resistance transporter
MTRRWLGLTLLLTAAFMDLLDGNIVNVAIPTIRRDLGATYCDVQWIIAGYTLACAVNLITGGRMGDVFGRRRMFMIGTAGFTVASALCALATVPEAFIAARVFQGAMTAIMLPQVLAIIRVSFGAEELGRVAGLYAVIGGLAIVGGPVIGGLLMSWNPLGLQWRSVFLLNLPVGAAALVAAPFVIEESRAPGAPRLDLVGAFLATVALLLLIYPLTYDHARGWPAWNIASLVLSVPLAAVLIAYERCRARSPLLVLTLFRARAYTAGLLVQFLCLYVPSAFFLVWTLYVQLGLGWSALHAGLTTIAFSLAAAVFGGLSMRLTFPRFGRGSLFAGAAIMILGLLSYARQADTYGSHITSWQMVPSLALIGAGLGLVIVPATALTLMGVPRAHAGAATGMINAIAQLGSVLGVALSGVVFFGALARSGYTEASRQALWPIADVLVLLSVLVFVLPKAAVEVTTPAAAPAPPRSRPGG